MKVFIKSIEQELIKIQQISGKENIQPGRIEVSYVVILNNSVFEGTKTLPAERLGALLISEVESSIRNDLSSLGGAADADRQGKNG